MATQCAFSALSTAENRCATVQVLVSSQNITLPAYSNVRPGVNQTSHL